MSTALTHPSYTRRARCPWHWARTRGIQAHSLSQGWIAHRRRSSCSARRNTRSGTAANRGGCFRGRASGLEDGNGRRAHKHAPAGWAVEVSLALDSAIVLPRVIFEFDANPVPYGEMGVADEADGGITAIAELYVLSNCYLGHVVVPLGLNDAG